MPSSEIKNSSQRRSRMRSSTRERLLHQPESLRHEILEALASHPSYFSDNAQQSMLYLGLDRVTPSRGHHTCQPTSNLTPTTITETIQREPITLGTDGLVVIRRIERIDPFVPQNVSLRDSEPIHISHPGEKAPCNALGQVRLSVQPGVVNFDRNVFCNPPVIDYGAPGCQRWMPSVLHLFLAVNAVPCD